MPCLHMYMSRFARVLCSICLLVAQLAHGLLDPCDGPAGCAESTLLRREEESPRQREERPQEDGFLEHGQKQYRHRQRQTHQQQQRQSMSAQQRHKRRRQHGRLSPANADVGAIDEADLALGVWPPVSKESFTHMAPTQEHWCPWCMDKALCRRQFLFIVAVTGSDSALVMNMVDILPGITIWDENKLMVKQLMQMDGFMHNKWPNVTGADMLGRSPALAHPRENLTSFYGDSQDLLWDMYEPPPQRAEDSTVRGFVDIDWMPNTIEWASVAMPCSRFIVSYRRDVAELFRTGRWTAVQRELRLPSVQDVLIMENKTRLFRHTAETKLGRRAFEIATEDYNVHTFNRLADWLGSPCRFNQIAASNVNGSWLPPQEPCEDCLRCPSSDGTGADTSTGGGDDETGDDDA